MNKKKELARVGNNMRPQRFILNGNGHTDGHTDGQTDPIIDMRGRIQKQQEEDEKKKKKKRRKPRKIIRKDNQSMRSIADR